MSHTPDHVARLQKKANDLGCTYELAVLIDDLEKTVTRLKTELGESDDPDTLSYRLDRLEERVF